jgi:CubicO group peptidase (beta-lactamase class C family)
VAVWRLIDQGVLSPSQPIVDIFPEFGRNGGGKERVTLLHLLTFTAGLPAPPPHTTPEASAAEFHRMASPEGRAAYFGDLQLESMPGEAYAYDRSAPWVVAEIITRATGRDFREYIRGELLEPMGLVDIYCGEALAGKATAELKFVDGVTRGADAKPELYGIAVPVLNLPVIRALMVPGGGCCASAADLGLFYQPLLNGGHVAGRQGEPLITPATLNRATTVHTDARHYEALSPGPPLVVLPVLRGWMVEVAGDDTVQLPPGLRASDGVHGMGGIVAGMDGDTPGKVLRGCFGYSNSAHAFGHNGAGGQAGWGDPATGISFAFLTNTFSEPRKKRVVDLSTLANLCALTQEEETGASLRARIVRARDAPAPGIPSRL